MKRNCEDCGTRLERNGVCSNCDEAAFIMDTQSEFVENPSQDFKDEVDAGYKRAEIRNDVERER